MNNKILKEWTEFIGHERVKIVINHFLDKKIDLDFPNLGQGNLTHVKRNIITELEDSGTILMELEGNILSHEEIIIMIDILANNLISKSLPDTFIKNISRTLLTEERLDMELDVDEEIKITKKVLDSIHRHEDEIE